MVLDTQRAVLMDYCEVATTAVGRRTPLGLQMDTAISMVLAGRINKTDERARVLFLFDTDGAAAIISELMAVAVRQGPAFAAELRDRIEKLDAEGNMEHRDE